MNKQMSTSDYTKFQVHAMNRLLMEGGGYAVRKDLMKSMREQGFRKECPITCYEEKDGSLKVIDGHNRLSAAMALKLPVEYIAYKRNGAPEMTPVQFSRTQAKWSMEQCARAYAQQGNGEYVDLLDYCERYGVSVKQASSMLSGHLATSSNVREAVLDGTFCVKTWDIPETAGSIIDALKPRFNGRVPSSLVAAISRIVFAEGFDANMMIEKIKKYQEFVERCRTCDQYVDMLEAIYNRNFRGKRYLLKHLSDEAARTRNASMRNRKIEASLK